MGTDNFVEDVHGGFQCEVQKPYVLYRNRANEVRLGRFVRLRHRQEPSVRLGSRADVARWERPAGEGQGQSL